MSSVTHPEPYESYRVGDEVFCLAWIGMPFRVTGKDDVKREIYLDGTGPCSLREGCGVDINPNTMFMLTHEIWDQVWYWPDRAGETYKQVVDKFILEHFEGQIVTGYVGGYRAPASAESSMAFMLSFGALDARHEIYVQPMAALAENGRELVLEHQPSIPFERWMRCGPPAPLRVQMVSYRWALTYGEIVLNWRDFASG